VPSGSVHVNTVRGLLTSVATGRGDVSVTHVEGNLHVANGAAGSVTLGKIMGEDLRVLTSGTLSARALYSKRLDVEATGGMNASVVSAEEGRLVVGGDTRLDSTEGVLQLAHQGEGGSVTVQAGEMLRSLSVVRVVALGGEHATAACGTASATGGEGDHASADKEPEVTIHLPEGLAARAEIRAHQLAIDDTRLAARLVTRQPAGAAEAAAEPEPSVCFIRPLPPLSTSGTKTFAGYEHGSSTASVPWWTAAAKTTWAMSADMSRRAGCDSYVLGGAKEIGEAAEIVVLAEDSQVTIGVQSWFEQRLKLKTERKAQPYR